MVQKMHKMGVKMKIDGYTLCLPLMDYQLLFYDHILELISLEPTERKIFQSSLHTSFCSSSSLWLSTSITIGLLFPCLFLLPLSASISSLLSSSLVVTVVVESTGLCLLLVFVLEDFFEAGRGCDLVLGLDVSVCFLLRLLTLNNKNNKSVNVLFWVTAKHYFCIMCRIDLLYLCHNLSTILKINAHNTMSDMRMLKTVKRKHCIFKTKKQKQKTWK